MSASGVDYSRKDDLKSDEELLASLGYKQELKRDFSWPQLLGLSFSIIGVVQSISAVLVYAIPYGGPVSMVWGWAVCSCFLMAIAFAMAELASAAPTSGGLYYWTFMYSSPRYRNILSWIVGYSNTVGYISGVSGADYSVAVQILAAVTISSGGTYIPTAGHIFGVFCAVIVFHAVLSSLATKYVARLQTAYLILNILLFGAVLIALPVVTPSDFKNSAKYALGTFQNLSLWPNGFAFMLSFLAPAWTVGGIDSSVHISEEVKNASVAVPRVIVLSTALACILGWAFNVVITFNMGTDTASILENPIGQPMATILFNSFGEKGTLVVWTFIIITLNMSGMDLLMAASRQSFAFSRDGALPFSSTLYKIHPATGTPVVCVWACALCAMLLGLLSFAGPAAAGAVFTMGVVCQYIAYSIPIAARFLGGKTFNQGSFSLGKLSLPVALVALAYMGFMIIILLFPADRNPTSQGMNYTVVVVGGILTGCVTYYLFPKYGGRHWFIGPIKNISPAEYFDKDVDTKSALGEKDVDTSAREVKEGSHST